MPYSPGRKVSRTRASSMPPPSSSHSTLPGPVITSEESVVLSTRMSSDTLEVTVSVWSGVVSIVAYKLVDIVIGLRVPEDEEREGLDLTSHGETAYHH